MWDIHSSYGRSLWNQLLGTSFKPLQSLRAADGRILVEGLYEEVQEPNERELALVDAYAQRNPGGNQPDFMAWNCLSYKRTV